MLSMNTPTIDAIANIEAVLTSLNHKKRYRIKPIIPVVANTNSKLLSDPASAWLMGLSSLNP